MAIGRLSSVNVLVVEDEKFSQQFVTRILDSIGVASIVVAESGAKAIEHLNDEKSSIDLIICDIEMPGMDGFEFVRRLRYGDVSKYKDVPILMLTGVDTPRNVRRGRYHKIAGFLVKWPAEDTLRKHMLDALGLGVSW